MKNDWYNGLGDVRDCVKIKTYENYRDDNSYTRHDNFATLYKQQSLD